MVWLWGQKVKVGLGMQKHIEGDRVAVSYYKALGTASNHWNEKQTNQVSNMLRQKHTWVY